MSESAHCVQCGAMIPPDVDGNFCPHCLIGAGLAPETRGTEGEESRTLVVGQRLGPHAVIEPIGKGGMGEVYRARDTSLGRDVALKVLPDLFAGDPQRLARFQREAEVLASLNHPNIAQIYGLEASSEVRALVLELVEGPTLADCIAAGSLDPVGGAGRRERGIPLAESRVIARQIVDALEAAHDRGVIHRDLKPANIKVRHDGTVKVESPDIKVGRSQRTGSTCAVSPAHLSSSNNHRLNTLRRLLAAAEQAPQPERGLRRRPSTEARKYCSGRSQKNP